MTKQKDFKLTPTIKKEIIKIIDERIREAHITREDFSELKNIVKELAEAQKRTEQRVEELTEAQKNSEQRLTRLEIAVDELTEAQKRAELRVEELAEAQKRTEERLEQLTIRVDQLAEAQKRTEERLEQLTIRVDQLTIRVDQLTIRVDQLAEAQRRTEEEIRKLAIGLNNLRGDVGGLARSFGYAFENEAYRMLPKALKEKYGIDIKERLIRTQIGEHEINILGFGNRNGTEVVIVGEVKTRLERMEVFDELEEKVKVTKDAYKEKEIVKVLVTHFATKNILKAAQDMGIIVIQSFEW